MTAPTTGSIAQAVEAALAPLRSTINSGNLAEVQETVFTAVSGSLFEMYGHYARVVDVTVTSEGKASWTIQLSGSTP